MTKTIVYDPEEIKTIKELEEDFLKKIIIYERKRDCSAGVILIQRRQFKGLYKIVSEEEGKEWMRKPVTQTTPEFGIKFWPRSYFEELKEKLKKEPQQKYN